jgi:molybdopterin converting factor small subunit
VDHRALDHALEAGGGLGVLPPVAGEVRQLGVDVFAGANVLVAIFAERESHAAYFLQEQDMTRYDAVNYPSGGLDVDHRALDHALEAGGGLGVLPPVAGEVRQLAAYFLQEQDMTRYDAVNYISHGIAKRPGLSEAKPVALALGEDRHQHVGPGHLLPSGGLDVDHRALDHAAVMRACNVDVDLLKRNLVEYIDTELSNLTGDGRHSRSAKIATSTLAPVTSSRPEDWTWITARWITRWKPATRTRRR